MAKRGDEKAIIRTQGVQLALLVTGKPFQGHLDYVALHQSRHFVQVLKMNKQGVDSLPLESSEKHT